MKFIKTLIFIFVLLLALALGSENGHEVVINLLFVKLTAPLSMVLVSAVLVGVLITVLSASLRKVFNKKNA